MLDFLKFLWSPTPEQLVLMELRSPQWPTVRNQHLKLYPACELCGTLKEIEVHHVLPVHIFPKLELEPSNFMTLCRPHHYLFGHLLNWCSYNPTVREDVREWAKRIRLRPQLVYG